MTLDSNFYNKLIEVSNNVNMKPEDLLLVMQIESGIDPRAYNKGGKAGGLLQIIPSTLASLGFKGSSQDFTHLSASEQLDYFEKMIKKFEIINGGPFTSATQYYIGNFVPAALKIKGVKAEDPSAIICSKNPTIAHIPGVSVEKEQLFYNSNTGLDYDHDGNITYGDIQKILQRGSNNTNYKNVLSELKNNSNYKSDSAVKSNEPVTTNDSGILGTVHKWLQNVTNKPKVELQHSTSQSENLMVTIEKWLKEITADNKKIYKYLPKNNITIKILSNDITNSIEFAKVASFALNEELDAKTSIHSDDNNVEINCCINGPIESIEATKQLIFAIKEAFYDATKKIGSITTDCKFSNIKSVLKEINADDVFIHHRKFITKFITK